MFTRRDFKARVLADGSEIWVPVFHFFGTDKNAPSVYIQSSVHGAEVQGYAVSMYLMDFFLKNRPRGNVTVVPMANPYALNHKSGEYTWGRFDPVTGENWNRHYLNLSSIIDTDLFKHKTSWASLKKYLKEQMQASIHKRLKSPALTYAEKLAACLQSMAVQADVVLDLHCDTISVPHVYVPDYAVHSAYALGIQHMIRIPKIFSGALDEAIFFPWWIFTDEYNRKRGAHEAIPVESMTIELGNHEQIDDALAKKQALGILNYLSLKKIIQKIQYKSHKQLFYVSMLKHFKTVHIQHGGILWKSAPMGVPLPPKTCLYRMHSLNHLYRKENYHNKFIRHGYYNCTLNKPAIVLSRSTSCILHEGMPFMKMMTCFDEKISER